ncbi:MAG: class I SAM-dependent methyltransferase [Bacteriovoracaceae bacterium]|nr:class I SAM-dependent methyltransferase [Bacteriovoracaceae bacterium]
MNRFFFFSFFIVSLAFARQPLPASRFEHLTGIKMNSDSKSAWDAKFNRPSFVFGKRPAEFLADNYHYLPFEGTVLDMGMGEGRNAVFLAQKGFKVTGVDISSVAVKKAHLLAKEYGVKIKGVVASMNDYKIAPNSYDAIICFYYVDRGLIEKIKTWLRPGGILIYEAHTSRQRIHPSHRHDPADYFLKEQELLKMFNGMRVLKYEEPLHEKEFRASIILQKPQ